MPIHHHFPGNNHRSLWHRILAATVAMYLACGCSTPCNAAPASPTASSPLLVGYFPCYKGGNFSDYANKLDFRKMTHLNLAFGNPPKCEGTCNSQSNMEFAIHGQTDADITALVSAAHAAGVKVLLSIGGGGGDQMILQFYNAGLSEPLVASLDKYVKTHNLDGVDLDIEDPSNMGAPFAVFVKALTDKFHPQGRLVTAAVARYLQDSMPDSALHQFDFINVMSYSSYNAAVTALQFYSVQKLVPKNKIVLGVPFFAQNSDGSKEEDYGAVLAAYPNAWRVDIVGGGAFDDGQAFNYVGEATMAQEILLAKGYGGVMIWQLLGDAAGPHSLLHFIQNSL
jgi:chitinase